MNSILVVNLDDEGFTSFPFSVGNVIFKYIFGQRDLTPLFQLKISQNEHEVFNQIARLEAFVLIDPLPLELYCQFKHKISFQRYGRTELEVFNLSMKMFPEMKLKIGHFRETEVISDTATVVFRDEEIATVEDPYFDNMLKTITGINRHALAELKNWEIWEEYCDKHCIDSDLLL